MGTLSTLADIRQKRLEDAQTSVLVAHSRIEQKKEEIKGAKEALEKYEKELPDLIAQLYLDVIGKKVDVPYVQEKVKLELKLTQKKQDFVQQLDKLQKELEQAQETLRQAQHELAVQERKKMAMQELIKEEAKQVRREEEQKLAKVIDELANMRYIAQHS